MNDHMHHLRLVHSVPASRPTSAAQAAAAEFCSCGDGGDADVAFEDGGVEPEVRILLEHVRRLTPLPNVVRARALGRARAALATAAPVSTMAANSPRPSRAALLVAAVLARVVGSFITDVRLPGVLPIAAAACLLAAAGILASLLPAARASRVDVIQALRSE